MSTDYTKHKDKRVNNPTIEERNFFTKEESAPYVTLYPRDPSLDPQLVWKGKDEQDREDLAVPTVPIYIQEKIQPQAIIEDLLRLAPPSGAKASAEEQPDLFGDFNGLDADDELDRFQKQTEFYQHDKNWTNRMILGDSLLVMNSLAEKEGLKGKVQCVFIDPPYGIKFGSNWQVSTRKRDVKDGKAEDAAREPEVIRAFRDTWRLGVHSYLSYLRDRLELTRDLLTDSGSIFVQIGDENVHLVRCLLDEVFGSENFISNIHFKKTGASGSQLLDNVADTLLWYAKSLDTVKYRPVFQDREEGSSLSEAYRLEDEQGERYGSAPLTSGRPAQGSDLREFVHNGKTYTPGTGTFKTDLKGLRNLAAAGRLLQATGVLRYKRFLKDFEVAPISNLWTDTMGASAGEKVYVVQTATKVAQRCILMATDPGDLVLDPTCGSGTTAYVAEQWGRRWITVDTSRVSLALARTRLMSARFPYYFLVDSQEGVRKEADLTGQIPPNYPTSEDIKKGFVYRRVPHVTLKSIANNPDIKEGMTREAVDKAVAKHAETELLFDQPYEDNKRTRVTGPFTVESLSPHRVLSPASSAPGDEEQRDEVRPDDFFQMVIDNLKKSGVQNTKKGERLKFDDLQPYAGKWIHAKGSYQTSEGKPIRVAISVGPEYGAVSPMQIKEAAKEAMEGAGHDVLVVCGYAFDPHVTEEAKHFGSLTVLPARMNADLAMGDDLLKKTGAGNLFMVFGEPDLELRKENGQIIVELKGLDVYDPTTGVIRGGRATASEGYEQVENPTDDVACWFIDTDYNGESFFVRHAYFTGADKPYEKLAKTLRAEIDESAWASLYSTTSRPFPPPTTGKIAVKVINHYGDEVLKVYEV